MSTVVTLELPDSVYQPLVKIAEKTGKPLEEWILAQLWARVPRVVLSERERAEAMARLMGHAGAVNLGHPTGADNESIDVDLAQEYSSMHEVQS
ncbi:MAG: hypothetical protein WBW48_18450 [Anaerolineae bacterium]